MSTLILQLDDLGAGILGRVLRDHGHRLTTVRLDRGEAAPDDLLDVQAVVICGRQEGDLPTGLDSLLAEAQAADLPLIGLGDGAAVIARALGGEPGSALAPGWHPMKLTPVGREDAVLAGVAWTSEQVVAGRSGIKALPKAGKALANFADGSVAAFVIGLRTYGFVARPELGLGEIGKAMQAAGGAASDPATATHLPTAERLARRIFTAIALLVAPVDRVNAGLAKDLHY